MFSESARAAMHRNKGWRRLVIERRVDGGGGTVETAKVESKAFYVMPRETQPSTMDLNHKQTRALLHWAGNSEIRVKGAGAGFCLSVYDLG
jgi:hypothetical protein